MKQLKLTFIISCILTSLFSCGVKDDPNELLNTQFAAEVVDSCHVLSPKTYSYLHNIKPPLGIKPVIVAVDKIEEKDMGEYADNLFDQFCEKKYSGHTFGKRGILIVASKDPELIQVRVGSTYAVYCRMRGSAAGADYLAMQKETAKRGIDEMCPVALNNVIEDIESVRELPWYKKYFLKVSFIQVDMLMEDLGTPSEDFFSKFYFQPFLYVVGFVKSILGSWFLSFCLIALSYLLITKWLRKKMDDAFLRLFTEPSMPTQDANIQFSAQILSNLAVGLIKIVISVPTFAAISVLSTSRTEDIIALRYANIPSVEMIDDVSIWTNTSTSLWIVLLLTIIYYLKFLLCDTGMYVFGHLPDKIQQFIYDKNKELQFVWDTIVQKGYNRTIINYMFKSLFGVIASIYHHNFHEIDTVQADTDSNENDDKGKPAKRLVDYLFYDKDTDVYKQSPFLTIMINIHREGLILAASIGLVALIVLSNTYTLYFLILWSTHLVMRIWDEYMKYKQLNVQVQTVFEPLRLLKHLWKTYIIFLISLVIIFIFLTPSYDTKSMEKVAECQLSLPEDLSGRYFVPKADGEETKTVTAKLIRVDADQYILEIYSDKPVRRIELILDQNAGLFYSDILGDGYISYDEQTKTTKINFSDLWILTN